MSRVTMGELTSTEFKRSPYAELDRLREAGPLVPFRIPLIGQVRLATTHAAVESMLRERSRFVMEPQNAGVGKWSDFRAYLPRSIRVLTNNMMQKDEPDHRRLRALAEQAFRRKNVATMRERIRVQCRELIDTFAANDAADLVEEFSRPFPLAVICELLGLPVEDREKFSTWVSRLTNASIPFGAIPAIPGIMKLNRYLRNRFELERKQRTEGLIAELVEAEDEGSRLSSDELLAMVFVLLIAGHETTTHLISLSFLTLLQHAELRQQWLDNPSIRPSGVDELLRYLSPVQMSKPRYVAVDGKLDGVTVKRGERVMALFASANIDPEAFDAPHDIRLDRHPNPHVGFGSGIHFCLGAQLARLETEIALTELLERFPDARIETSDDLNNWSSRLGIRSLIRFPVSLNPSRKLALV